MSPGIGCSATEERASVLRYMIPNTVRPIGVDGRRGRRWGLVRWKTVDPTRTATGSGRCPVPHAVSSMVIPSGASVGILGIPMICGIAHDFKGAVAQVRLLHYRLGSLARAARRGMHHWHEDQA